MIPDGARFEEEIAPGLVLYDVSHLLPRHAWRHYRVKPGRCPRRLFVHHSGALGLPGFEGMRGSAEYVVTHKSWPGFAYTFWAPFLKHTDSRGRLVVYRGQPDEVISNHTGGCNESAVALCLQGNLTKRPPSKSQVETLEGFVPWASARYDFGSDGLSWHSEVGKKTCPGPFVEDWLVGYRRGMRGKGPCGE